MRSFLKRVLRSRALTFTVALFLVLSGAAVTAAAMSSDGGSGAAKSDAGGYDSGFIIAKPGIWDSEDTAVVEELQTEENRITFMNIETGKSYTLSYDGTTVIEDKYGNSMAMSQLKTGSIVDVNFLKGKKKLTQLSLSKGAFTFENLERYEFDTLNKNAVIGDDIYSLRNRIVIISEGKEAELCDIIKGDVVTVNGIDHNIYSITVERGHGYLRLSDEEYFKDGWIEVGQEVIRQITQDMLLPVPEGSYNVRLTAEGIDETRQVTVGRNQEVLLDVGDIRPEEPRTGKILFAVTPEGAKVYIDGDEADISGPVELEYGIHQMIVKAEGYDSVTRYLKVGQELGTITVSLEETQDEDAAKENNGSDSVSANELNSYYKVYIDSPSDVEVYVDGVYKGMSPVSFKKEAGTHIITLRKTGYETKSYTVQIDDEEKDVTLSFTGLIKNEQTTVSGNSAGTVSGNRTVSGNGTVSANGTASGNTVSG